MPPNVHLFLLCFLALAIALPSSSSAESSIQRPLITRIRATDSRMHSVLDLGLRKSPSFRALVERLDNSDVIVFLECVGDMAVGGLEGRLSFLSASGGQRYLSIRVAHQTSTPRQLAVVAHELQHAVEVAGSPEIVDQVSMARAYADGLGFATRWQGATALAFESRAAMDTGARVMRELRHGDAD